MSFNFKQFARESISLSDIYTNRTKLEKINGDYHIDDFDLVSGTSGVYAICAVGDAHFINGGMVLTRIFTDIVAEFDGSVEVAREEFRKAGGLNVKLEMSRTKKGNNICKVIDVY